MKFLLWNVNGYRSIIKKGFQEVIREINPDIYCLQEMKVQEDQLSPEELTLPGYLRFLSVAQKKGYSGVGTFVREDFKVSLLNKGFGAAQYDSEGRILAVQ